MTDGNHPREEQVAQERDALIEQILRSTLGVFDIFSIHIGDRLGYYKALAEAGALTSSELAARTGTHERYAREWLEQQTLSGILVVEGLTAVADIRRFRLPEGHAEVLVERESLNYLAPLAQLAVGVVSPLDAILAAYCTGNGVPYRDYGADMREGQANVNRTAYLYQLGEEWIAAMPDVYARLQADPPARVADIGCGAGWSSIGIARAFPKVHVDGYDTDEASIELARANASEYSLGDRVNFMAREADDEAHRGRYDLVAAFECIHDMSDPVKVLRVMRSLAGENGAVFVVDERVGDTFTGSGDEVERMMYGWSILHCLPAGMAEQPSAGTGTVMRAETLRRYAIEAGFSDVEVLPVENYFFRMYRCIGSS
ncbi:MAG TPA: class I SAM-dependent methyltransferase [Chloroflexia bacterium]|nr:class I SAM-dependent methyltransferase [Chloroflexia bacterium]